LQKNGARRTNVPLTVIIQKDLVNVLTVLGVKKSRKKMLKNNFISKEAHVHRTVLDIVPGMSGVHAKVDKLPTVGVPVLTMVPLYIELENKL
jgi:hypothetical protein